LQRLDNLRSPSGKSPGLSQRAGLMLECYRATQTRKLANYIASDGALIKLTRGLFRGEIIVGIDTNFYIGEASGQPIPADDIIAAGKAFIQLGANGLWFWNFSPDKSLHPEMGRIVEALSL
jgi:hypothetical protein